MSELLLPVGNFEMALAAIHNGADAIYIGFPEYNARGRSIDFELEELQKIIQTCHLYGVKVHLALNIVIFPGELEALVPKLENVLPLKPDSIIVQDLGLALLLREMAPEQPVHASTQMTITNHEAIELLEDLSIKRFVLGRENSLRDIKFIKSHTQKEVEVFVHGALCVSYSGQCFTSESIGGRSANRGQCAQSCRFGYEMWVDGKKHSLLEKKYLVSPLDLCGLKEIPELINLGVSAFKIEGRLKSPEYVASCAQEYRRAIDANTEHNVLSELELHKAQQHLSTTYSRGFYSGWLHGVNHQQLVDGSSKSHRGKFIGTIESIDEFSMLINQSESIELEPGDGLAWYYWNDADVIETGAQIYRSKTRGKNRFEVEFGNEVVLKSEYVSAKVFLNHKSSQKNELWRSFHDKNLFKKIPVDIRVNAVLGEPLKVTISDGRHECEAIGEAIVQEAKNRAVSDDFFREELGALGGSVFKLRSFEVRREPDINIFYPHKDLKHIRRKLESELEQLRSNRRITGIESSIKSGKDILIWLQKNQKDKVAKQDKCQITKLNVLLREKSQVNDFIDAWKTAKINREYFESVVLDFEFGADYEESIKLLKEEKIFCGIATTRILKPKEYGHFVRIERVQPNFVLIRNLGALQYFTTLSSFTGELRGDFSLNVTNPLSANYLLSKKLISVTASYDLNSKQVLDLITNMDSARLEVVAHQYMPAFHMEHCVFAANLSSGSSFKDCGKPCEKHRVELKDEFGNHHQLKADPECRNTVFNSTAQSAAKYILEWKQKGLGYIRYEALYERGAELIDKINAYLDLLSEKKSPTEILKILQTKETYGLGEGSIGKTIEYQSRKKSR